MSDVTQLIHQSRDVDRAASEELLPLVGDELRKLAAAKMAGERKDHTLPPTALVHEAYLRLVSPEETVNWNGRGHFFAPAAEAMSHILINHARNRGRLKRGGGARRVNLDAIEFAWDSKFGDILEVHEALDELEQVDSQSAQLVKLRCFAGQTRDEAAALMGVSPSTAKRSWAFARAWLFQKLNPDDDTMNKDDRVL
jgi:RNA polymerase sigma factor (TIGR02999 family)